jgi:dihydropyrimidine dehydrogenase (NAD+) subunit PreA
MHYGFRIIEDLCDGLSNWMDEKGIGTIAELAGKSLHRISDFKDFDLSFRAVARIDPARCIRCNLCYVACNDAAHQCIDLIGAAGNVVQPGAYDVRSNGAREAVETRPRPVVREADCVGCRLCYNVCPVERCIEMAAVDSGRPPVTWDGLARSNPQVTEDWDAMERYRKEAGIEIH